MEQAHKLSICRWEKTGRFATVIGTVSRYSRIRMRRYTYLKCFAQIYKTKNLLTISADGASKYFVIKQQRSTDTNTKDPLYLGGLPDDYQHHSLETRGILEKLVSLGNSVQVYCLQIIITVASEESPSARSRDARSTWTSSNCRCMGTSSTTIVPIIDFIFDMFYPLFLPLLINFTV